MMKTIWSNRKSLGLFKSKSTKALYESLVDMGYDEGMLDPTDRDKLVDVAVTDNRLENQDLAEYESEIEPGITDQLTDEFIILYNEKEDDGKAVEGYKLLTGFDLDNEVAIFEGNDKNLFIKGFINGQPVTYQLYAGTVDPRDFAETVMADAPFDEDFSVDDINTYGDFSKVSEACKPIKSFNKKSEKIDEDIKDDFAELAAEGGRSSGDISTTNPLIDYDKYPFERGVELISDYYPDEVIQLEGLGFSLDGDEDYPFMYNPDTDQIVAFPGIFEGGEDEEGGYNETRFAVMTSDDDGAPKLFDTFDELKDYLEGNLGSAEAAEVDEVEEIDEGCKQKIEESTSAYDRIMNTINTLMADTEIEEDLNTKVCEVCGHDLAADGSCPFCSDPETYYNESVDDNTDDNSSSGELTECGDQPINEATTKDPKGLEVEYNDISENLKDFGPEGFYAIPFRKFREEYPLFTDEVIDTFISEMEVRTPEEMEDTDTVEKDWSEGELIIKEDWPALMEGASKLIRGRGKDNKHQIQWVKIWKKFYTGPDDVE